MRKNHDHRKIRSKDSYTASEIAEILHIHIQTVRSWTKKGLMPIADTYPPLYLGSDLKDFLIREKEKRCISLNPNEMYCMSCKKGVNAPIVNVIKPQLKIGKGKDYFRLEGKCPLCGCKTNRITTESKYKKSSVEEIIKKKSLEIEVIETSQIKLFQ